MLNACYVIITFRQAQQSIPKLKNNLYFLTLCSLFKADTDRNLESDRQKSNNTWF